jgi:hypothetical protein
MAFMFRLEQEDGSPADPPTFKTARSGEGRFACLPFVTTTPINRRAGG